MPAGADPANVGFMDLYEAYGSFAGLPIGDIDGEFNIAFFILTGNVIVKLKF